MKTNTLAAAMQRAGVKAKTPDKKTPTDDKKALPQGKAAEITNELMMLWSATT